MPGELITVAELERDPHPVLARLRAGAPVAWVPALHSWLVTGYDAAVAVLRDSRTFTVDDPRFSTARVVGPSMLSLDGAAHARHRGPFTRAFRGDVVHAELTAFTEAETDRLVSAIVPHGEAELRRSVAGPLAVAVMARVLGLSGTEPGVLLAWYDEIVAATTAQATQAAAGEPVAAFGQLADTLRQVIAVPSLLAGVAGSLTEAETISNAAVLLFGGIETTEGMITNAMLHLLANPAQLSLTLGDLDLVPAAIEESLRLDSASAMVDRYATSDAGLGGAQIKAGDQVTVSITGANRDPSVFPDPDTYEVTRPNAGRHLAFAHGPHFCLGAHLARLETRIAVTAMLTRLPRLRLAQPAGSAGPGGSGRPAQAQVQGLVFRKPPELRVRWGPGGSVKP
jgi:cytochrome P450